MPLYEYHCLKCGRFETLQKFSEGPLAACPTCGGAVERLISAPAFQFKGSGFYITDYGKSGSDAGSKESGSKDSESKSSEAAPDSKSSKEASTPPSADSKSSTNSPPKESTAPAAKPLAPAATPSQ
jgi:putative FmdB family regulatory protein